MGLNGCSLWLGLLLYGCGPAEPTEVPQGTPPETTPETTPSTTPVVPRDGDHDGYGDVAEGGDDCDDASGAVHPGAVEVCNSVDDNCDGAIDDDDPAVSGAPRWFADLDGDTYGDPDAPTHACAAPADHVADDTDCDDASALVNPLMPEVCNGIDDDCDGQFDAQDPSVTDAALWFEDVDGDGYGDSSLGMAACRQPNGTAAASGDCDDRLATVHPGAPEVCDVIDDDCDGLADAADSDLVVDAADTWYADADGDGWGGPTVVVSCENPVGAVPRSGDCDDADPDVRGPVDWLVDGDGDGFGGGAATASCAPLAGSAPSYLGVDCADADPAIHPGAPDVCGDGTDANCDGLEACHAPLLGVQPIASVQDVIYGSAKNAQAGHAMDLAPDVTGDGRDDVVLSQVSDAAVYVVPGAVVGAEVLGAGAEVARIVGEPTHSYVPYGVGDLDGDGFGDLVVGDPQYVGAAYTAPGAIAFFRGPLIGDAAFVDADALLVADYLVNAELGVAFATGDVTGDGVADLIAGDSDAWAPLQPDPAGSVYVFGDGLTSGNVADGATAILHGADDDQFGAAVVADDFDGDGVGDLVVGAPRRLDQGLVIGTAYLFLGPVSGDLQLTDAALSVRGDTSTWTSAVLAALPDTDGDGRDDFAVGGVQFGNTVWIWQGTATGVDVPVGDGFATVTGAVDSFGSSVSGPGDLDGDGFGDLVVGAPSAPSFATPYGEAFVFLGGQPGALDAAKDAAVELLGAGLGDVAGYVSRGGDLDGDGSRDWLFGAQLGDAGGLNDRGVVSVVYGASP